MNRHRVMLVLGLVLVVATVVGGMIWARQQAIRTYGSTAAQEEWDEWRQVAIDQAQGKGPVMRKAPKSAEPPALVLMRDHFGSCLGAALFAAVGLYGTFAVMLRGAFQTRIDPDGPDELGKK